MTRFQRQCLVQEGFGRLDDVQLELPLRFSQGVCIGLPAIGIATRNPIVFGLLATLAAGGAITRRHPFDLVWEYAVRPAVGGRICRRPPALGVSPSRWLPRS